MGLLDTILSTIDAKKRSAKRGIMDMLDNPSQWAGMQANRIQEDRYGGAENAQAMKQYLSKQPYDPKALTAANDALRNAAINESLGAVTAWHGSPHKFDKFDMSKIGTGEGAQAYGHGLYLAESPSVAKEYASANAGRAAASEGAIDSLPKPVQMEVFKAMQMKDGPFKKAAIDDILQRYPEAEGVVKSKSPTLYKVDIPDEAVARFLDWDKPLSQQAPEVQSAITKAYPHLSEQSWYQGTKRITDPELLSRIESELKIRPSEVEAQGFYKASPLNESWTGQDLLNHLGRKAIGASGEAEKTLNSVGIPGIRYLDGGSRGTGSGTSNYVLFDDQLPRILERNGQPTGLQPWAKGEWKGLLDDGPAMSVAPKLTEFEQRHLIAQKNAALPVEQGGLGLPPNNTAMDRARAMGAIDAYHGTADDVTQIDPAMFGKATGANSAKRAFWAVDDPRTASGYAEYAATGAPVKRLLAQADDFEKKGNWDAYDEALSKAEKLESDLYKQPLNGQNVMPLMVIPNNPKVLNANGAEFVDVEGGVNNFLRQAKFGKNDVGVIQNLADDVGVNGREATHYAVLNPASVRSRFAAFDPMRRHEADLLGYADPYLLGAMGAGGLLGMGGYSMMNDK